MTVLCCGVKRLDKLDGGTLLRPFSLQINMSKAEKVLGVGGTLQ